MTGRGLFKGVPFRTRAKAALARVLDPVVEQRARLPRILVYHSISRSLERDAGQMRTSVRQLEEHLSYLRAERYDIVDASTFVRRTRAGDSISGRTVVLTFDDGYRDFLELAAPLFRKFECRPTLFLVASTLERSSIAAPGSFPTLSREQVLELTSADLVDIGCHGMRHTDLRTAPRDVLDREVVDAKARLEDVLGREVSTFAYPFGAPGTFPDGAVRRVRSAGFIGAFTSVYGSIRPDADPYRLPRNRLSWAEDPPALARLLRGSYDWYAGVQLVQGLLQARSSSGGQVNR